mmetsp:Transcript_23759/g.44108  ORF Transcript_23759/g.44108 Transcript_23759/m.44108 type:complete len:209 (-) Transcript_23759:357-983(-)
MFDMVKVGDPRRLVVRLSRNKSPAFHRRLVCSHHPMKELDETRGGLLHSFHPLQRVLHDTHHLLTQELVKHKIPALASKLPELVTNVHRRDHVLQCCQAGQKVLHELEHYPVIFERFFQKMKLLFHGKGTGLVRVHFVQLKLDVAGSVTVHLRKKSARFPRIVEKIHRVRSPVFRREAKQVLLAPMADIHQRGLYVFRVVIGHQSRSD